MAQKVKITVRRKKHGSGTGYKKCPNCGGDGRVKTRNGKR